MNENLFNHIANVHQASFLINTKYFLDMTEFIPSAPALTAVLNNDVIQVSWDKPEDNPHRVDHYELYWQGSDSPSTPEQVSVVSQCQKPSNDSYLYTLSVYIAYFVWLSLQV